MKQNNFIVRLVNTGETKPLSKCSVRRTKNIYNLLRNIVRQRRIYCMECDNSLAEQVHHKDNDRKNTSLSNVIAVCKKCHMNLYHLGETKRKEYIKKIYTSTLKKNKIIRENISDPVIEDMKELIDGINQK